MKVFRLLTVLSLGLVVQLGAEVFMAGRGHSIDASLWTANKGKIGDQSVISDRAEVFACFSPEKKDKVFLGGTLNNNGTVWIKNLETGEITTELLPQCRTVYALTLGVDGTLYAAGAHYYLGGGVWKKSPDREWESMGALVNCSVLSAIVVDSSGKIFTGGISSSVGKVWIYNDAQWNRGQDLVNAREINTLCIAKDVVYAAGKKSDNTGGLWFFQGDAWAMGDNLKFSTAIYASAVDSSGVIYLAGAGIENKILWENSEGYWNAHELKEGLAIYTLFTEKKGVYAAGWNKQRKGRFWYKAKKEWNEGSDIRNCFVIRSIS